jgi:signal transduction histidine kinase
MERILDDLLELSRSESGAPSLEKEEVPLREFLLVILIFIH